MSFKVLAIGLAIALALYIVWAVVHFYSLFGVSRELVKNAKPFDVRISKEVTLLVLGDSSAVGVGATGPEDSVPARLAARFNSKYVENLAVSGARIIEVEAQLAKAELANYSVALVMIGGNDITHFLPAITAASQVKPVLEKLKAKADRVIFISAGNIGAAPIFPVPLRMFYTHLNLQYHEQFEKLAGELGIEYVNQYIPPDEDPFTARPEIYLAGDQFHPSSEGYRLWYERIK